MKRIQNNKAHDVLMCLRRVFWCEIMAVWHSVTQISYTIDIGGSDLKIELELDPAVYFLL